MQQPSPDHETTPANEATDMASCRALLRNGSRTFYAASFLLPRHVREPASALYAFCRLADDAVDIQGGTLVAVHKLRDRLDRAYRGRPMEHPVDRALAVTVKRLDVPIALPEALLAGLEWDVMGRRCADLAELQAYAARVAGSVGAMMSVLMGARSPDLVARACDLGVAMQLTNVARDVGEDARAGRIYLPLDWMRQAGIDPETWLANPKFSQPLGTVIERILDTADFFYDRADTAIAMLPVSCRPGIRAARLLYSEIGHELRRNGLDSVSRRTVVPADRKLKLIWRAMSAQKATGYGLSAPCLEQTQFLVDAIAASENEPTSNPKANWWDLHGQALRLIDLFESLERRQRGLKTFNLQTAERIDV